MEPVVIDYTEQLHELILQSQLYNDNLTLISNDIIKIHELSIILFGFVIGYIIVSNIIKVMLND